MLRRLVLLPVLLACLLAACRSVSHAREVWVVASDLDNRPFAWVDEQGVPRGRDVEMMQLLASELGAQLEWRRLSFDLLLPACERAEVDIVCATLGISAERARRVNFTQPYFETYIALVVRVGEGEPKTLADLVGRRIAASPGTTSESAVREHLPRSIGSFEGSKDAGPTLQRLLERSIDAAAMDAPAARALVVASDARLQILATPLAGESYALALPHSRADLVARLDTHLQRQAPALRELDLRHGLRL